MKLLLTIYIIFFALSLLVYLILIYFTKIKLGRSLLISVVIFIMLSALSTYFILSARDQARSGSRIIKKEEIENW